ncbi:MAG: orotidine 5'-phosphate decarboxylase [Nitrososphaerales archaeon]
MSDIFIERIKKSGNLHKSKLVLALDLSYTNKKDLLKLTKNTLNMLGDYICAVKINFHLLLPLDLYSEVKIVTDTAHSLGLQTIADVKLSDISNTNEVALSYLWSAGFDALTMNPSIGFDTLRDAILYAHKSYNGVIALVYMSHKGASDTYGINVIDPKSNRKVQMYEIFLNWIEELNADGIVVGATLPEIIKKCSALVKGKVPIFSPGIGAQGGDAKQALASGSDYLIVGRSIIEARDPKRQASQIRQLTWS